MTQSVLSEYTVAKQKPGLLGCQPDPLFLQSRPEAPPPSDSKWPHCLGTPNTAPVLASADQAEILLLWTLPGRPTLPGPVPPPDEFGPLARACLLTRRDLARRASSQSSLSNNAQSEMQPAPRESKRR